VAQLHGARPAPAVVVAKQAAVSRWVPDLGCEQDGEEQPIPILRLPHVCTDWCEAGHCREGEGRLSCFGYDELYVCVVAVCLKSPCTARDGLRIRGRECYNIVVQRLTQRWQSVLKMTGTLWRK
jgi:hypothetical protein